MAVARQAQALLLLKGGRASTEVPVCEVYSPPAAHS